MVQVRYSLGLFLIVVAIAGPVIAMVYLCCFAPEFRNLGGVTWVVRNEQIPQFTMVVASRHFRSYECALFVVVMPTSTPRAYGPNIQPIRPLADGITICGDRVFINAREYHPKSTPCFLVYDPRERTFVEIPFDEKDRRFYDENDLTRLPLWKRQVIPLLESLRLPSANSELKGTSLALPMGDSSWV